MKFFIFIVDVFIVRVFRGNFVVVCFLENVSIWFGSVGFEILDYFRIKYFFI